MYIEYQFTQTLNEAQQQMITTKLQQINGPDVSFATRVEGTRMILSQKEDPNNHQMLELGIMIGMALLIPVSTQMAQKLGIEASLDLSPSIH